MQFVRPRYKRVMQFPVTITVPLDIVLRDGLPRTIRLTSAEQALPAPVVTWLATSPNSPHRDAVEPLDAGDDAPAGQRTVNGTATIVNVGAEEVVIVPEGAQVVFNEDNGLGVDLSAAPVVDSGPANAPDALESAGVNEGVNTPASAETPASATPSKPAGQPKPAPAKPQAAKGKPAPTGKKK